jgi:hypothetical protein
LLLLTLYSWGYTIPQLIYTKYIMSLNIKELYNKYETIIKYSTYTFTGWVLSWVLFFIMLPGMISYFGKVKGSFLNYIFSWILMFIIIIILSISKIDAILVKL